jgi:hypothetical protein
LRRYIKGGREMLMVVVELNTGKKVVGTTEVGWNKAATGHRDDVHAALYEVGRGRCRLTATNPRFLS